MSTAAGAGAEVVQPSEEFSVWLTGALSARNASLDVASLVDYLTGVLAADAASGEGADVQRESVRDIVLDFGVLGDAPAAAAAVDALAEEIVGAFNRLCISQRGEAQADSSELSSAEAEALARVREMTVKQQQTPQHPSTFDGSSGGGGGSISHEALDKRVILQAFANLSGDEYDEDADACGGSGGFASSSSAAGGGIADGAAGRAINNRAATQSEEKLRRERMKLEHAQKLERDRLEREKQKNAKEARKEAEKKRTQKQERRK